MSVLNAVRYHRFVGGLLLLASLTAPVSAFSLVSDGGAFNPGHYATYAFHATNPTVVIQYTVFQDIDFVGALNSLTSTITDASQATNTAIIAIPATWTGSAMEVNILADDSEIALEYTLGGAAAFTTETRITNSALNPAPASSATTSHASQTGSSGSHVGSGTSHKSGLSGGAIAGIVIGSLLGFALIACIAIYLLLRHRRSKERSKAWPVPLSTLEFEPGRKGGVTSPGSTNTSPYHSGNYNIPPGGHGHDGYNANAASNTGLVAGASVMGRVSEDQRDIRYPEQSHGFGQGHYQGR